MPNGHLYAKPIDFSLAHLPEDWKITRLSEPDEQGCRYVVFRRYSSRWKCKKRFQTAVDALMFIERTILNEGICGR